MCFLKTAPKTWFDRLTTNGISDRLATNGITDKLITY